MCNIVLLLCNNALLCWQELDGYLLHHTYMAGYGLSLADVVLYYALHKYLVSSVVTLQYMYTHTVMDTLTYLVTGRESQLLPG